MEDKLNGAEHWGNHRHERLKCPLCTRTVCNAVSSLHQHFVGAGHDFHEVRNAHVRQLLEDWEEVCASHVSSSSDAQRCPGCDRLLKKGFNPLLQHAYDKPRCRDAVRESLGPDNMEVVREFDRYMSWEIDDPVKAEEPASPSSRKARRRSSRSSTPRRQRRSRSRAKRSSGPATRLRSASRVRRIIIACPLCGYDGMDVQAAERHFRRDHACRGAGVAWLLGQVLATRR